jgi:hypothetical protein
MKKIWVLIAFFVVTCSRDSIVPMSYKPSGNYPDSVVNMGFLGLDSLEGEMAPQQVHIFFWEAIPLRLSLLRISTYNDFYVGIFVNSSNSDDVFLVESEHVHGRDFVLMPQVMHVCTLMIKLYNIDNKISTGYLLYTESDTLDSSGVNAYRSDSLRFSPQTPVRAIVANDMLADTIAFDHHLTKYLYVVPLGSYEAVNASIRETSNYMYNAVIAGYSSSHDSLMLFLQSVKDYWSDAVDTLFIIAYVYDLKQDTNLVNSGIYQRPLPTAQIAIEKTPIDVVHKDVFHDDTLAPVFLVPDITYKLSIYNEPEDVFCYNVRQDTVYELIFSSRDKKAFELNVSQTSGCDFNLQIDSIDTLIFQASPYHNYIRVETSPTIKFPCAYSLILRHYTGTDTLDLYELDNDIENATILYSGIEQNHTMFPPNESDVYKFGAQSNDTVHVCVCTPQDSAVYDYTLEILSNTASGFPAIMTARSDSSNCRTFSMTSMIEDTVYFGIRSLSDIRAREYTVLLKQ